MNLKYSFSIFLLTSILLNSCKSIVVKEIKDKNQNVVVFVVLHIQQDSVTKKSQIKLLSMTKSNAQLKNKVPNKTIWKNYLSLYIYDNEFIIDSMTIEHPLYKHLEYYNGNSTFSFKDTIVKQAEFFIRFQSQRNFNVLRIVETRENIRQVGLAKIKLN